MRKMFEIKCKIPVAFYVEAETADEAITTIRPTLSGKRIPSHANVIQGAAIRSLDKLRLAVFLNDIHSNVKDFPSDNLSWCDWLNKPDDGHLLDVKTAR